MTTRTMGIGVSVNRVVGTAALDVTIGRSQRRPSVEIVGFFFTGFFGSRGGNAAVVLILTGNAVVVVGKLFFGTLC